MQADVTGDHKVDFYDLVRLAQNYGTTHDAQYWMGDLTGDGAVNFEDLVILSQRYNTALPASTPAPAAPLSAAKGPLPQKSVFSAEPVKRPKPRATRARAR
jgi:hypothetical protein